LGGNLHNIIRHRKFNYEVNYEVNKRLKINKRNDKRLYIGVVFLCTFEYFHSCMIGFLTRRNKHLFYTIFKRQMFTEVKPTEPASSWNRWMDCRIANHQHSIGNLACNWKSIIVGRGPIPHWSIEGTRSNCHFACHRDRISETRLAVYWSTGGGLCCLGSKFIADATGGFVKLGRTTNDV
jgi:hypothetical protein